MVAAISKNTFISFVFDGMDNDSNSECRVRARSAEVPRHRTFAEEAHDLTQPSIQRLNGVLNAGLTLQVQKPLQKLHDVGFNEEQVAGSECPPHSTVTISELDALKEKLSKALASTGQHHRTAKSTSPSSTVFATSRKLALSCHRVSSCYSLSTMADEECESPLPSLHKSLGSPKSPLLWPGDSSSTLSTMSGDDSKSSRLSLRMSSSRSISSSSADDEESENTDRVDDELGALGGYQRIEMKDMPLVTQHMPNVERNTAKGMQTGLRPMTTVNNIEAMRKSTVQDEPPTTMMIRNIPFRYSQSDFIRELKELGFAGTFDFVYLPMSKCSASNSGYAFVNFIESDLAAKCKATVDGYFFKKYQRAGPRKLAKVSVAHLQGLNNNLEHYEKAAVNLSKEKKRRPMVFANIATVIGQQA